MRTLLKYKLEAIPEILFSNLSHNIPTTQKQISRSKHETQIARQTERSEKLKQLKP